MQDKIYTNLLQVGIMQLYKTSEREHAKVRHDDIYILTTENKMTTCTLIVKSQLIKLLGQGFKQRDQEQNKRIRIFFDRNKKQKEKKKTV